MSQLTMENTFGSIDRNSYIRCMMTAFAQCAANGCKKPALSPPFYPEDRGSVKSEAEKIVQNQGIY
jgi:hypothetical protein